MFVASPGNEIERFAAGEGVQVVPVRMTRETAVLTDIRSLWTLTRILHRLHPTITNFGTPKAGLLGNIAAKITAVPCRIYMLHGFRLETAKGLKKRVLMMTERIACKSAHRVLCVSPSLRQRAVDLGLVAPDKAVVLASGTCNGVDVDRFLPTAESLRRAEELRDELNLPKGVPVIGFVGRFTRDKGIPELVEAYGELRAEHPELRMLLVGDFEDGDPVPETVQRKITLDAQIVRPGFVADTSPYYHLMDVLVLPTYREGFPGVSLEAQAAGKPVVTTTATGAIDSVQDGKTGLLVPVGDASALARAIGRLLADPAKREEMGRQGQEWVAREFAGDKIRAELVNEYQKLMREKLGPTGRRSPQKGWSGVVKWGLDILCASAGLAVLWPVLGFVALLIRMVMGKPVLFRQTRPGFLAKPFSLLKFRTMRDAFDAEGHPLPDGNRLTRLGIWLRELSLDELPQIWNVLRGDMSLVGPRPLLIEYLPRYTPEQARRHEVMPGITGWTQVNGRNALTWEQKFAMDTWYVEHWSLKLDCKILAKTAWRVIKKDGISNNGHVTMPEFRGPALREQPTSLMEPHYLRQKD